MAYRDFPFPKSTDTMTAVFTVVGSPENLNPGRGIPGHGGSLEHHHPPRNIPGIDCGGPLPTYAGGCTDAPQYSSACSCLGITAMTTTLAPQVRHSIVLVHSSNNLGYSALSKIS